MGKWRAGWPDRRRVIGGLAGTGVAQLAGPGLAQQTQDVDRFLRAKIGHVVVIYAENRSFNNLFSNFPGLAHPLSAMEPKSFAQRDRDGAVLEGLPPIWGGLVPIPQTLNGATHQIGQAAVSGLSNRPFTLRTPDGGPLPLGLVTRDLVHAFYHNQMQIKGGRNDGFVAWGDSGALVMAHYTDAAVEMRLAGLAREFALCDNFFMGAFGGSFLNHQYLIAARPPFYPDANISPASHLLATLEGEDPKGTRLKPLPRSPASAMDGPPKFAPNALTPDFWAVNTMLPPYPPTLGDESNPLRLPPQVHKTIGDVLHEKGVEWAWYAGAWQASLEGATSNEKSFPPKPVFKVHHQPLNYFVNFAPGTAQRAIRLRDGGLGSTPETNEFMADTRDGKLPTVTFYKPQGDLDMHAGYSNVADGDNHIAAVINQLRNGPQWHDMLIIVTFDENGGWWDHVAPPKGDRWGPGSRIPTIVISPHVRQGHVEHTVYDTGSIVRFLTRRFDLEKLQGLTIREQEMRHNAGFAPGDLTELLAV